MTYRDPPKNWGPYGVPLQISTLCHQSLTKQSLEKKRSVHNLQFVSSEKRLPPTNKEKTRCPWLEAILMETIVCQPLSLQMNFTCYYGCMLLCMFTDVKRLWASNGSSLSANDALRGWVLLSPPLFGKDHEMDSTGETQMGCSKSMIGMNVESKVFNLDQSSFILHHSFKRNFADLTLLFVHFE